MVHHVFVRHAKLGKAIRAVAQSRVAAQMNGMDLHGAIRAAFTIGDAPAGFAAFTFAIVVERPVAGAGKPEVKYDFWVQI